MSDPFDIVDDHFDSGAIYAINQILNIHLGTIKGEPSRLVGVRPSDDRQNVHDLQLDAEECARLSMAFAKLVEPRATDIINGYFALGLKLTKDGTVEGRMVHELGRLTFMLTFEDCQILGNAFLDLAKQLKEYE